MKRKFSEEHRRKISEAQKRRWAVKKSIKLIEKVKSESIDLNDYRVLIDLNDYESIKEVLHNCALAGLTLTRVPSMLETTEVIKNVGAAIGEVCLEGLSQLKNAKITKKPGRKKNAKKTETANKKGV